MTLETAAPETEAPQTEAQPAEPSTQSKREQTRKALEGAMKEVEARESRATNQTEEAAKVLRGEPEGEAKPKKADPKPKAEAKPSRERGEDGKFRAKDAPAQPAQEPESKADTSASSSAPKRFSREAQDAWESTPEPVRKEVERALSETEAGISKYREAGERMERLRPYEDYARQFGGSIEGALDDYVRMSQMIRQNPEQVMRVLAERHGFSFEDIASRALDRPMGEFAEQATQTIQHLQSQLNEATRRLQEYEGERRTTVDRQIADFRDQHPRFDELAPDIQWILETHRGLPEEPSARLKEAYRRAERLIPADPETTLRPTQAVPATPAPTAQTDLAALSTTGAPSGGSNPAKRKPGSTSVRDSLRGALARTA